ncbi:MAG TPA: hypothetical protein VML19_31820 [Verrucomicrobiae bacterium]|nr:hypothetical protein [Verrucomicrobiae bacterium]
MQASAESSQRQPEGTEAALHRSARLAWIAGLFLAALAGVYFVTLFLITH